MQVLYRVRIKICIHSIASNSSWNILREHFLFFKSNDIIGGAEQWDKAVTEANAEYRTRMHNLCCDNCHSHVAYALNSMEINAYGIRNWDMVKLCFLVFFKGRFLSAGGFVAQFLPFSILVMVIVLVKTTA